MMNYKKIWSRHHIIRRVGFTLVEVSIVLVIIGLVFGGVLVGRDLIFSAQVRSQISQIEEIETQINTFKSKYNCLPGDCINATDFFGTTDASGNTVNNGDGDGVIRSYYSGGNDVDALYGSKACLEPDVAGEIPRLFLHLYLAGLSKDFTKGAFDGGDGAATVGVAYPYAKLDNGTGIFVSCLNSSGFIATDATPQFMQNKNVLVVGVSGDRTNGSNYRIAYATGQLGILWYSQYGGFGSANPLGPIGIPAEVGRRIDEKIDDGNPSSGRFGIIAGEAVCDNTLFSHNQQPLLSAYPSPSVSCNVTVGKSLN